MLLGFYKVNNACGYERYTFINDKPDEIVEKLKKLPEDEYHIYDLSTIDTNVMHYTLGDFVEDFNDEVLDGSFWTVVIQ